MPYHLDLQPLQDNSDEQKEKTIQKGTRDEHPPELQWGSAASVNKDKESIDGLAVSLTVL